MRTSTLENHRPLLTDTLLLLLIPTVLAVIHFGISTPLHDRLVFTHGDASVLTAWTAAYLHVSDTHLYSNIAGYAISISFSYYIYHTYLQKRRPFWGAVIIILVVTPFITTAIDYAVLYQYTGLVAADAPSQGFSGIVGAFTGLLLAVIGLLVADEYDATAGTYTALLIFLVAFSILTVANGILTVEIAGLLVLGIGLLVTGFLSVEDLRQPAQFQTRIKENTANIVEIASYGGVVCILVYTLLPIEVVQSGYFVNVLSHTTGFIFGVVASILANSLY